MIKDDKMTELQGKVFGDYIRKTIRSKKIYDRARMSLTGGVSGHARLFQPYPLYMTRGKGSKIWDADSNEYIDCFLNAGALLLGHCHPEVMEVTRQETEKGLLIYNSDLSVRCAELLREVIPCAERVRFANTGTEAVMFAVRCVRAFTGKNKVIKFYGHYHGQDDQFLIGISTNENDVISLGVPLDTLKNTVLLRYGCIDDVVRKLDEDEDIAGIILEPQMNMGGIFPASKEYLKELTRLTKERGIPLIFDEVITGFRLSLGGAQEYFGVIPDLACYSKSIAGGAKFAALVGKEEIMDRLIPSGFSAYRGEEKSVFQSGTYNDGIEGMAGALAAIKIYKRMSEQGEYKKLHERAAKLAKAIELSFKERGIGCHVNQLGPSLKIFLTNLEPSFETYSKLDRSVLYLFFLSQINEGIILSWPSSGGIFLSFAHTDEDIEKIIEAVNISLENYKFEEIYE
ncbi:MAG: aspartate aminotransferase family protein [Candidatus Hodarchaeota archaeon]